MLEMSPRPFPRSGAAARGRRLAGRSLLALALAALMLGVCATPGRAQSRAAAPADTQPAATQAAQTRPAQGPFYPVTRFALRYMRGHPDLPKLDTLERVTFTLGRRDGRFVAPAAGDATVRTSIARLARDEPRAFSAQAVQHVLEAMRDALTERELMGVYVAPDPRDLGEDGRDLRPADRGALRLVITVGRVTDLRTVAAGERIDEDARINHPAHRAIRQRSPIQPAQPADDVPGDLLRRDVIDEYVYHLSRHPGRRADVTLSAAERPSGVTLDYLITENKPWAAYAQLSNTGTAQTDRLREQFGFFHNQLTGNDDIFQIEYLTAAFDESNAVRASYEAPLFDAERMRWRVHASWSDYTASDVGFFNDTFTGTTYDYGGALEANLFQHDNLFVDAFAGARVLDVAVDNTVPGLERGREQFLLPHVGLQLEQRAEWYDNFGRVQLEWHTQNVMSLDEAELGQLGRPSPDAQWAVLSWNLQHAVFLEPLLNPKAWRDPSTPASSTLAHEVSARFRGQHAFGSRLIPQLEQVAGGLYTVRGYPESVTAGDTVLIGNLEYRFHVPRVFEIEQKPRDLFGGPFRFAPQYVYGAPDWDLAPRVFLDAGYVIGNSNAGSGAVPNETLVGTGVGFDVSYKRNFRFSLDWGWSLTRLENGQRDSGEERLHFVVTVLY